MAKVKNELKETLAAAGRDSNFTNRSFYCKAVNAALASGLVKIEIAPEGKSWKYDEGKKQFNLKVTAGGYQRKKMIFGLMTPNEILREIGYLLLDERVKEKINSFVHLRSAHCTKCSGRGIIPQFYYYCSGICFDCGGTGYNHSYDKNIVEVYPNK